MVRSDWRLVPTEAFSSPILITTEFDASKTERYQRCQAEIKALPTAPVRWHASIPRLVLQFGTETSFSLPTLRTAESGWSNQMALRGRWPEGSLVSPWTVPSVSRL